MDILSVLWRVDNAAGLRITRSIPIAMNPLPYGVSVGLKSIAFIRVSHMRHGTD